MLYQLPTIRSPDIRKASVPRRGLQVGLNFLRLFRRRTSAILIYNVDRISLDESSDIVRRDIHDPLARRLRRPGALTGFPSMKALILSAVISMILWRAACAAQEI